MRRSQAPDGSDSGSELDRLVTRLRDILEQRDDLAFAYLFGSRAKGTAGEDSDIDLGVLFRSGPGSETVRSQLERSLRLETELEAELGRPVQVVDLSSAPPGLVHNILHTGQLVCRADRAEHARFYVAQANRYFDLAPARAIFDRYRARRIEQGEFGGRTGDRS